MEFDHWYKQRIETHREEPPAWVWDELENRLDVAQVWHRIDHQLTQRQRTRMLHLHHWVAAASIALFVFLGYQTPNGPQLAVVQRPNTDQTTVLPADAPSGAKAINRPRYERIPQILQPADENQQGVVALQREASPSASQARYGNDTQANPKLAHWLFAHTEPRGMRYHSPYEEFYEPANYYERPLFRRVDFGVIGSLNNIWLVRRQRIKSLADTDGSSSMSGLGKNIGLIATLEYTKKLSLQAELVHSQTNQRSIEPYTEKFTPNELYVNFLNLNLLAVRKQPHLLFNKPASHNLIYGGGFGYMTSANLVQGQTRIDVRDKFTRENLSINLGYEYEVHPRRNWTISTGMRATFGLTNIERIAYSEFNDNRSNIFSWGAHVAIKYTLWQ